MHKPIILASASLRRKQLLEMLDLDFTVVVSQIEEVFDTKISIVDAICSLALQKAQDVAKQHKDAIIIGADTMVVYDNHVLGKPKDAQEAKAMLTMLSGKKHQVISGVAILTAQETIVFHEVSDVYFYPLSEDMIDAYIATKEPMDKAGAYGIQAKGSIFVKEIKGDYFNIVGLPIAKVYRHLLTLQK